MRVDVQVALGVADASVQVLCHQRGSVIAQVVLRASEDQEGKMRTARELAAKLQNLVKTQDRVLQELPVVRFAKKVDIHGPIPEALAAALNSAVQDMARQGGASTEVQDSAVMAPRISNDVSNDRAHAEEREAEQLSTSQTLDVLARIVQRLEADLGDLRVQLEGRTGREG